MLRFEASNCQAAITNNTLKALANIENPVLEHLDIQYANFVTDEGLDHFEGKTFPIKNLLVSGLSGVTGMGLYHPIFASKDTLQVYHGAMMDQEDMKIAEFGKALGCCTQLQIMDLALNKHMTDEFFNNIFAVEIEQEKQKIKPGLPALHTVKLNYLDQINDASVAKVLNTSDCMENLELAGCINLTEYFIENMFKNYASLKFVDLNNIPIMTPAYFETLKGHRPDMLNRRYKINEVDPKDNMLRVPLRTIEKKSKKKKGKKKKK
jgi:hypothetical protein